MGSRAVQADRVGGIEVLTVREVPAPTVGAGQVLVRTVASSLNPVDRKMRVNQSLSFPLTLGWDVAGIVVESVVAEYEPGDRVIAMTNPMDTGVGAWADLVALDAEQLAPAPTRVALSEAATLPLAGLTGLQAWNTLVLSPEDRVLVTGAAGAIGGLVVQLAVNAGIQVDGLVSRPLPSKGVDVRPLVTEKGQYVATGRDDSRIPGGHSVRVTQTRRGSGSSSRWSTTALSSSGSSRATGCTRSTTPTNTSKPGDSKARWCSISEQRR